VDKGTSILLTATPREDYNAETVITALVDSWLVHGLLEAITFDRDPRFVGSWTSKEFPSPFMRLLLCLGIRVDVCPAHRPQKNGYDSCCTSMERFGLTSLRRGRELNLRPSCLVGTASPVGSSYRYSGFSE
jgi:hypothetical protein